MEKPFQRPLALMLLLAGLCAGPVFGAIATNGPTISLRYSADETPASPVADFMYFIPLISPVPVASLVSPGNTQALRMTSCKRSRNGSSFTASCELEVQGSGKQQSLFDIALTARRHKRQLENGKSLDHQLKSIDVRGPGVFLVEVNGEMVNDALTVNQVCLHFNGRGHVSPVWIDLCDIVQAGGNIQPTNEIVARVNNLTFERQPGPARMKISISSIKGRDAGDNLWQNLKGRVASMAANMFIPPLRIENVGNQTMLDFGGALISQAPTFTFPKARNLRNTVSALGQP